jgi:hypothetical protein
VQDDVVAFVFNREGRHGCFPFADAAAVITFITSLRNTSKWIVENSRKFSGATTQLVTAGARC